MKTTFLEFEQPIAELETRIEELRFAQDDSATDITDEIQRLTKRSATLTKDIYGKLSPWQVAQVARHPQRPFTLDYVQNLFTHFEELHGDRTFSDDPSIVGGLARFNGTPCMVLAGNDEAHPFPISEEVARLLPNAEFIPEWKTGAALASAKPRVKEFLLKHTPTRV